MQEPEQQIIMQAETDNYDGGCALFLWTVFLIFWCCLIIAALVCGFRLLDVLRKSALHSMGYCAAIGLVQIGEYLLRPRIRIIVTPSFINLVSVQRLHGQKIRQIPVTEIREIQVMHNSLAIFTANGKHVIRHFANAARFAEALRPFLRQQGADIPKTAQEHYYERLELTEKWKRKREERAWMPQSPDPVSVTTDENGEPILPQCLTDEQAEGVFRPAGRKEEQQETVLREES